MKITQSEIGGYVAAEMGVEANSTKGTAVIMELVADLEGARITREQLMTAAVIGASMRAYDDQFDTGANCSEQAGAVSGFVNGSSDLDGIPDAVSRGIIIAQDNMTPEAYATLQKLTDAQIASMAQRNSNIEIDDLTAITKRKGGLTALLFALEINPAMSEECQFAYKELGYLLQLLDDYSDVDIDKADGIYTLSVLDGKKVDSIIRIMGQIQKVKAQFALYYSPKKLANLFQFIDKMAVRTVGVLN